MNHWIPQLGAVLLGGLAIWFVGRRESWRRWGYILGLCGQPFWLWTTIAHEQYAIAAMCLWYAYSWAQGVWNYWIRPASIAPETTIPRSPHLPFTPAFTMGMDDCEWVYCERPRPVAALVGSHMAIVGKRRGWLCRRKTPFFDGTGEVWHTPEFVAAYFERISRMPLPPFRQGV